MLLEKKFLSMSTPIIIWWCVVGVFLLFVAISVGFRLSRGRQKRRVPSKHHVPLFEVGQEREEFFAPGDPLPSRIETSENDD